MRYAGLAALVVFSAVPAAVAQGNESTAIIQTSTMAFRVTGAAAGNFSTANQAAFSNQLRSLLSSFNFMSIAVSNYTVRERESPPSDTQELSTSAALPPRFSSLSVHDICGIYKLASQSFFPYDKTLILIHSWV